MEQNTDCGHSGLRQECVAIEKKYCCFISGGTISKK